MLKDYCQTDSVEPEYLDVYRLLSKADFLNLY